MTSNSQAVLPKHFALYPLAALPFRHRHFDGIAPAVFPRIGSLLTLMSCEEKHPHGSHTIAKTK